MSKLVSVGSFCRNEDCPHYLDNSIQSKIVTMAFSMAAEIERYLISQRTKEALPARKKAEVKLGQRGRAN